jgi:hypothetical protein
MKLAYIVGPYSSTDRNGIEWNIKRAVTAQIRLFQMGYNVHCPHANTAHLNEPMPEWSQDDWYRISIDMLLRCDLVVKIDGWERSRGSVIELEAAKEAGIPIYLLSEVPEDPEDVPARLNCDDADCNPDECPGLENCPVPFPAPVPPCPVCEAQQKSIEKGENVGTFAFPLTFDKAEPIVATLCADHKSMFALGRHVAYPIHNIPFKPCTELPDWVAPPTLGDQCDSPEKAEDIQCVYHAPDGRCHDPKGTCGGE